MLNLDVIVRWIARDIMIVNLTGVQWDWFFIIIIICISFFSEHNERTIAAVTSHQHQDIH